MTLNRTLIITVVATLACASLAEALPRQAKKQTRVSKRSVRSSPVAQKKKTQRPSSRSNHLMSPAPVGNTMISTQASSVRVASASTAAASAHQSTSSVKTSGKTEKKPTFGVGLLNVISTSPYESESASSSQGWEVELSSWVALSKSMKMDIVVPYAKSLSQERKGSLKNIALGIFHEPIDLRSGFKYRSKFSMQAPTDVEVNKATSFTTALSIQNRLYFTPPGLKELNMFYQLSGIRNIYRYTTTRDGESNTAWRISHRLVMNYELTDSLSAEFSPAIYTNYTFAGSPMTVFNHSEGLGYAITKAWTVALGHDTEGPYYKANGKDSNVSVFDKDQSKFYLALGYVF